MALLTIAPRMRVRHGVTLLTIAPRMRVCHGVTPLTIAPSIRVHKNNCMLLQMPE